MGFWKCTQFFLIAFLLCFYGGREENRKTIFGTDRFHVCQHLLEANSKCEKVFCSIFYVRRKVLSVGKIKLSLKFESFSRDESNRFNPGSFKSSPFQLERRRSQHEIVLIIWLHAKPPVKRAEYSFPCFPFSQFATCHLIAECNLKLFSMCTYYP